jgi:hypothetical protein
MDNTPLSNTTNGYLAPNGTVARRARDRTGDRITRFVFTLPNWTQEEYDRITSMECRWMIVGKEISPETGTPHLQGACILGSRMAFSTLKTLIGSRCHIEPMHGKPECSLAYCSKEDSNPFVKGTLPTPGKRNDIHVAAERILSGESVRSLALDPEVGAVAVVKFHKGLTVLRSMVQPRRTEPPKVFWIFGPTGTGKTRCALESGRRLAGLDDDLIWISSGSLRWFDGYDGHPVVIFDDFRAKDVSWSFLLRLLDRYPVSVEFKGGSVAWLPKYIFITCPKDIEGTFEARNLHKPEDLGQLKRRVTQVFHFADPLDERGREQFCATISDLCREPIVPLRDEPDRSGQAEPDDLSTDLAELGSSSNSSD